MRAHTVDGATTQVSSFGTARASRQQVACVQLRRQQQGATVTCTGQIYFCDYIIWEQNLLNETPILSYLRFHFFYEREGKIAT